LIILSNTIFTKIPIANGYINAKIADISGRQFWFKKKYSGRKKDCYKKNKMLKVC